ncbi:NADPH-dependent F420 reductase [Streptomyces huiliensis]|uniref:NADPH-dependent F420 reductase n=1 Tax=Streptomyces huiliensis TaxID=2876027 RepID=UPI001CBF887B|nr:NAD(P)-binding domain-containing protein [Streptomyces huiliensis]MBZ4318097.1 NAD(P)-binding domain-containing protein [Streptomyces huiliensis]
MRIGVLGTGNMADALATHWVRAGHEVTIGGRDTRRAERLATRIGGGAKPAGLRAAAAAAAPGARVVKAFNLCHEDVWRMRPPVFDARPLAVPVCGDDETALVRVRELVRDVGCEPVAGGGLERAGLLEATAALFIALWVGEGADAQAIAPPLAYAAGPSHSGTKGGMGADA